MGDLPALQQGLDGHVDRLRGSYNWAVEKPAQPDAEVLVYRADVDTPQDSRCVRVRRVWADGTRFTGFEGGGGVG
jgi:hypothetical protein